MSSLLKIEDLQVSVEDTPILKGVNLDIRQGEMHASDGPQRFGKEHAGVRVDGASQIRNHRRHASKSTA